ncbi:MAG TPA: glycosyltransferase [Clostridiaceae bacterium]|nr:glycosyltransferase [Clostridiaceae bacterium]
MNKKNHTELLDIFFELLKKDKSFKLLLIGDGELKNQIISKSKEIGIFDKIIFLEAKKNIYDYYQAMDLFIMPSIFEGLPIVGIEAQTSGLKCIFSKNITEESNITGNVSFVELENHNEWCNQIIEKRNNYTISGRTDNKIIKSLIESGYDLKNETKKIENIFDSLIN